MKDTREQVLDRLASFRENPPEVIPEPRPKRRLAPIERAEPHVCPTCHQPVRHQ